MIRGSVLLGLVLGAMALPTVHADVPSRGGGFEVVPSQGLPALPVAETSSDALPDGGSGGESGDGPSHERGWTHEWLSAASLRTLEARTAAARAALSAHRARAARQLLLRAGFLSSPSTAPPSPTV